jgi:hypothetical protein
MLFEMLNERYFQFAENLPAGLAELATRQSTYLGSSSEERFEGVIELNPVLAGTPWLFWETFCGLDNEEFLQIAEAGTMYVLASILLDHLVDGQAKPVEEIALLHQAIYGHGIATYRSQLTNHSTFWSHFDRLSTDHLVGLAVEVTKQSADKRIRQGDLRIMAHGKVSPIVTTIAALASASERMEVLEPIEASLKHIAVASQLLDDIGDWKHDIEVGHRTYYLSQIVQDEGRFLEDGSIEKVQKYIDDNWSDVEHLRMVLNWLGDSIDAMEGIDCPSWIEYVEEYLELTDEHLTTTIARHLARKLRPLLEAQ